MGRKKVRNYPTKAFYEELFKKYFDENKEQVHQYLLEKASAKDMQELHDMDMRMAWGLDCGWSKLYPNNEEMRREWRLDNGEYFDYIFDIGNYGYNTQSVTLKTCILEKALQDLKLDETFYIWETLD